MDDGVRLTLFALDRPASTEQSSPVPAFSRLLWQRDLDVVLAPGKMRFVIKSRSEKPRLVYSVLNVVQPLRLARKSENRSAPSQRTAIHRCNLMRSLHNENLVCTRPRHEVTLQYAAAFSVSRRAKAKVKPKLEQPRPKKAPGCLCSATADQGISALPRSGRRSPSFSFCLPHHHLTSVPYLVGNAVNLAAS